MENFTYDLNIFTNCTLHIDSYKTILETYNSFCNTFEQKPATLWVDPNPLNDRNSFKDYIKYINKTIPNNIEIRKTTSLSDGYIQAINNSNSDFCFMLEHDWVFSKKNIKYTLPQIFLEMVESKIHHLRFNLRNNWEIYKSGSDIGLWDVKEEVEGKHISYCTTPSASNNPHILNNSLYKKDLLKYLKKEQGGRGIEQNLINVSNSKFAILGDKTTPYTIKHLDGQKRYFGKRNHLTKETVLFKKL